MSDALVWEIIKNNNSFLVKRNGRTSRTGAVRFSSERGNVMNLSSFKYSGLANSRAVDIQVGGEDGTKVTMATKATKSGNAPKTSFAVTPLNKNFRRSVGSINKSTNKNHYRSDLKQKALARYNRCKHVSNIKKSVRKAGPVKRCRGSKQQS